MGNVKNTFSLILFSTFLISFILKLVILYKREKVKANVLAKGNKVPSTKYTEVFVKTTTFIWGAAWLVLSLGESFISNKIDKLFNYNLVDYAGVIITFIGLLAFILAMVSMKASWRVGIDKTTKTKLITQGVYKYSRNPAFVGFNLMFLGVFLMYPNVLTVIILMLNILSIHLLILQEEKHLALMFGSEYIEYCNKTPRYIF